MEAALALRHAPSQPGGTGWLPRHYELVSVVLAAAGAVALSASTVCLLGAAAARNVADEGPEAEALLGQEGGRGKRRGLRGGGGGRMRLIHGTLRYLVPDRLHLKLRCGALTGRWAVCGLLGCVQAGRPHAQGAAPLPAARPTPSCAPTLSRLAACFLLLLLGRVVNIALPLAYKKVVDDLARAATAASAAARAGGGRSVLAQCGALLSGAGTTFHAVFFPWVAAYLALTFLQGSNGKGGIGLLSNLRDLLWIPLQQVGRAGAGRVRLRASWIDGWGLPALLGQGDASSGVLASTLQRACRRVSLDVFAHLLSLDHAFHLKRNTGAPLRRAWLPTSLRSAASHRGMRR